MNYWKWSRDLLIAIGLLQTVLQVPRSGLAAEEAVGKLLITEVYYNSPGFDAAGEWIEIANVGSSPIVLSDYKIGDEELRMGGEGMVRFPKGALAAPGQVLVVAQSANGFRSLFGTIPDYEIKGSSNPVPDMIPYSTWSTGEIALANDGDEVLLLNGDDHIVDSVVYGESNATLAAGFLSGTVADIFRGQSIERSPGSCDTDTAIDWQPSAYPNPGSIALDGQCMPLSSDDSFDTLPIGEVQGPTNTAAYLNRVVNLRGVVTGVREEENERGVRFHTIFVQDLPGLEDGDPSTSDGIAVFTGTNRTALVPGDIVGLTGKVTEFYGMTELDDEQLQIRLEGKGHPMPTATELDPPAPIDDSLSYLEALESMLVSLPAATVVGPTHAGCGFAVVRTDTGLKRIVRQHVEDLTGQVIGILHTSDADCLGLPMLDVGFQVEGLFGPLTYHFDQFKLVQQDLSGLIVTPTAKAAVTEARALGDKQYDVATFNLGGLFDTVDHTGSDAEPKLTIGELNIKIAKLTTVIAQQLGCPVLLGLQEAENVELLAQLTTELAGPCAFEYQISHRASPDQRGADTALLSDPRRIQILSSELRQSCTVLAAGVSDPSAKCPASEQPLFSRPPLLVKLTIEGQTLHLVINHFKSKRGGEQATELIRQHQAVAVSELVQEILSSDDGASIIVLGDFNDYANSVAKNILTSRGRLHDVLTQIPKHDAYSYNFGGYSQLVDWLLVSPSLRDNVVSAEIIHSNADYASSFSQDVSHAGLPFRSSDHDIPRVVLRVDEAVQSSTATAKPTRYTPPTAVASATPFIRDFETQATHDSENDFIGLTSGAALLLLAGFYLLARYYLRR